MVRRLTPSGALHRRAGCGFISRMMQLLKSRREVDDLLASPALAVLFKHSPRCPVSFDAHREMEQFWLARQDVPIYKVDVVQDRPVSQYVAERTGTVHQSPQVILLLGGEPVWCGSHYAITAHEIEREIHDLGAP